MIKPIKDNSMKRLNFLVKLIDLFTGGMISDIKEVEQWDFLAKLFRKDVSLHNMSVALVSGTGNTLMYGANEYDILLELGGALPFASEPRFKIVMGPIVCVHEQINKSILVQLFLYGWAEIYASWKYQPQHFRLNGFYTGERSCDYERPSTVFVEGQHLPDDLPLKRLDGACQITQETVDGDINMTWWLDRFKKIRDSECIRINNNVDLQKHFIFLTNKQIKIVMAELRRRNPGAGIIPFEKNEVREIMELKEIFPRTYDTTT